MLFSNLLLISGLAAIGLSEPLPQFTDDPFTDVFPTDDPFATEDPFATDDPFTSFDDPFTGLGGDPFTALGALTSLLGSLPTGLGEPTTGLGGFNGGSFAPLTTPAPTPTGSSGGLGGSDNPLTDMPQLPSSLLSIVESAAPSNYLQNPCQTGWIKSLPGNVQSQLSSYEIAIQSWWSAHSTEFPASNVAGLCTNGVAAKNTAGGGGATTGAAPRPTGALAASFAGAVGLLGVMVAL
jgi:hypothetical protein